MNSLRWARGCRPGLLSHVELTDVAPAASLALVAVLAALSVLTLPSAAVASPGPSPAASAGRGDPADPARPVPRLEHRSVLGAYRAAHDVPAVDWRTANQTVNRIGGWRAYAREAAAAAAPPPSAPASGGRR